MPHRPAPARWHMHLYGTNHDSRLWPDPNAFLPERFSGRARDDFDLVAQGAGDYLADHRCPGDRMTVAVMEHALELLTSSIAYDVAPQDLTVRLDRIPALPASGFVVHDIRRRSGAHSSV